MINNPFRKFIAAIGFLVVALCAMIATQEYVLQYGHKIILKTAPVDPRDAFRGDYVILSYDISDQAREKIEDSADYQMGDPIYVALNTDSSPAQVRSVHRDVPQELVYLKGRVETVTANFAPRISFPTLSQYYVPEGRGHILEDMPRGELHVEISIKNGAARILNIRDKNLNIIDIRTRDE